MKHILGNQVQVMLAAWMLFFSNVAFGAAIPSPATPPVELLVVDPRVADYPTLLAGVRPGVEVHVLDSSRNGVEQVSELLAQHRGNVRALHLLSHGAPGAAELGADRWTAARVGADARIAAWRQTFAEDAEILFYGCDVGAGKDGAALVYELAARSGARVAASGNTTGSAQGGGDWQLEVASRPIATPLAFEQKVLEAYPHTLPTLNVGDVVVIGWNALNNTVRFIPLVDLPSGTVLKITDQGWTASSAFNGNTTGDGIVVWTLSANVSKGTVFELVYNGSGTVTLTDRTNNSTISGSDLAVTGVSVTDPMLLTGDGIFLYQDNAANPYFLFGFNNSASASAGSDGWNTSITLTLTDSLLPDGTNSQNSLTNGTNAVGMPGSSSQQDNVQYNGPTTAANAATWLARVADASNWTGDNTGTTTGSISTNNGTSIVVTTNTAPVLTLDGGTLSYTENGSATQISSGATATDTEGNWDTGTLAVNISANAHASDVIAIGTATGLTVSGTNLLDGATTFGTLSVSGGSVTGSTTLTITFNSNATTTRVQNLVRAITFANTSDAPSTSTRTVTFALTDGAAGSTSQTRQISFTAVNDAPSITAPGSISITEDVATALTGISFTDVDAGSGSVTATFSVGSGTLAATSGGGVTVSGSGTTSLSLSGSVANINTFIAGSNVTFTTALNSTANVTLTVGIDDGGNTGTGGAQTASTTVTLSNTAVNDAPSITAPGSISVTEDVGTALTGISFADVDAGSSSVTVTLSVGSGTLAASSGGGVTVSGSGTASMTLSGSIANINTFIAGSNVTFTTALNGSSNVTLTVGINDGGNTGAGGAQSASTTVTLSVSGVNDAPSITAPGSISITEDVPTALTGISFADVDAGSSSVTASFSVGSGTLAATSGGGVTVAGSGTASLTLTGSIANINTFIAGSNLTFTTALNSTGNVTLTVGINDGGNTGSGGAQSASTTVTLSNSAVNDAPTITAPGSISVTEDTTTALTGISFADVDAGSSSVTVTLSVPSGTLTATSGGGVTVAGSGTGSMTLDGSIANINSFIAGSNVSYVPVSNSSSNVVLTVGANDNGNSGSGGAQSASTTVTLTLSAVNDAPTITAPGSITITEDTTTALTGISFADVDAGSNSVTATLSAPSGQFFAVSGGGVTVAGSGTASLTLTGSIANINTFIAGSNVTYLGAANNTADVTMTVGINDGGNTGSGGAQSASTTVTISFTAVNDAPTQTLPGAISVTQNTASPLTGISFADVDVGSGSFTATFSVPAGTFTATSGGGVTVSGSGTASLTLSGTLANINTFISGSNLNYTTANGATGTVTLTVGSNDNGNTGSGGAQSASGTVTLNIQPLNGAPVLTVPGSITVMEDAASALTGISVADADAGGGNVTLTFSIGSGTLTATSGGGVTVGGSGSGTLTLNGTLANLNTFIAGSNVTYTTASNLTTSQTLTVGANDNGNTGGGGARTDSKTVTLNVTAVNDVPSITASNVTVSASPIAQTISNWGTLVPGGGADEAGQTALSYTVTAVGTPAMFTVQPTVAANGTLSFTPAGTLGSSTFTVQVRDSGGTANGGVDTSAGQTFTITFNLTATSLSLSKNPSGNSTLGQNVTFTASVTGTAPTGNVAFTDNGNPIAGCAAVALGGSGNTRTAACTTSALGLGAHTIAANYAGDAGNGTANGTVSHTVTLVSTSVDIMLSPSTARYGEPVVATANVMGGVAGGTVSFYVDGQAVAGCQARSDATCQLPAMSVGSHSVRAAYSGAGATGPSEASKTLLVEKGRPSLSLSAGAASGGVQPITAQLSFAGGYQAPGGQVQLRAPGAECTATLAGGTGSCTLAVKAGSARITATYAGDANYTDASAETRLETLKGWPQSGWWWAATVPGRGYFIDVQNEQLLIAVLAFDVNGASRWYLAQGPLQSAGPERWTFNAAVWSSFGGQELTGDWRQAMFDRVVGSLSLWFDGPTRAMQQSTETPLTLTRFPLNGGTVGAGPTAGQPETGFWWNPAEPGRGFQLEVQSNLLMTAATAYESLVGGGAPAWYLGSGPASGNGSASGSWSRLGFGPTWSQAGTAPSVIGSSGTWRVQFSNERVGMFTMPDGRQVPIERFLFQ